MRVLKADEVRLFVDGVDMGEVKNVTMTQEPEEQHPSADFSEYKRALDKALDVGVSIDQTFPAPPIQKYIQALMGSQRTGTVDRDRLVMEARSIARTGAPGDAHGFPLLVDQCANFVNTLDLSLLPWKPTISLRVGPFRPSLEVTITISVEDRETRQPSIVRFSQECFPEDSEHFERFVFELVRKVVLHELDEAWVVNGVRERDPHAGEFKPDGR